MGLPVAVINFDEFISLLNIDRKVAFDTTELENILNQYFPEIIHLLEKIKEQNEVKGIQRMKGFCSDEGIMEFIPSKDILITGITISQSIFDNHCKDKWDIIINSEENCFIIAENIYSKDSLQHKFLEKFYPVPKGYKIIMNHINSQNDDTTYWIDLEYLEL